MQLTFTLRTTFILMLKQAIRMPDLSGREHTFLKKTQGQKHALFFVCVCILCTTVEIYIILCCNSINIPIYLQLTRNEKLTHVKNCENTHCSTFRLYSPPKHTLVLQSNIVMPLTSYSNGPPVPITICHVEYSKLRSQ